MGTNHMLLHIYRIMMNEVFSNKNVSVISIHIWLQGVFQANPVFFNCDWIPISNLSLQGEFPFFKKVTDNQRTLYPLWAEVIMRPPFSLCVVWDDWKGIGPDGRPCTVWDYTGLLCNLYSLALERHRKSCQYDATILKPL